MKIHLKAIYSHSENDYDVIFSEKMAANNNVSEWTKSQQKCAKMKIPVENTC